jgi:cell division protein FtsW
MQRFRRTRRSELVIWWREIDRVLLGLVLVLMIVGAIAVAAASPASAHRLSTHQKALGDLYFFWRQLEMQALGLIGMFAVSLLPKDTARRAAIMLAGVMIVALVLVPIMGTEVKAPSAGCWASSLRNSSSPALPLPWPGSSRGKCAIRICR